MSKINLIDIGAVGGLDVPWKFHQDKIGRSLSFEPNEPPILTGEHLRYDCAVWNFDGEAKFYVSGPNGTGSSLLKQNFDWVRENFEKIKNNGNQKLNDSWFERSKITKEFPCKVKKLDTILEELKKSTGEYIPFHFLKSDTQSGEFFVLEGAEKYLLEDCLGLELELFRYPLYEHLVTEDSVKSHLNDLGFYVAGWTGYQNSFNSQSDYLFLRKNPRNKDEENILNLILRVYNPQGKNKIIKSKLSRLIGKIKSFY
ncbi:MAG: FkbM family methyltransferase [Nostocaceae cyanobacterium]|nr:FkbM family methyltransferase [Nostocaceae cyanobacterium]